MPTPTDDQWESHIGTRFSAPWGELTLSRVDRPMPHSFSIVFDGPLDGPLEQGIITLEHRDTGEFDLFLVPIGDEDGQLHYEAVFSRLPPEDPTA